MFDKYNIGEKTVFPVQWCKSLMQQQDELWKYAIKIYKTVKSEYCTESTTRLTSSYEYFAKIEPNLYVSRPRFVLCLRQAFANESSINCFDRFSPELALFLQSLSCEREKVNWRTFFLMMYTLDSPKWSFKDIATRALYLLLSDDKLFTKAAECRGRLKISLFCDAIAPIIALDKRKDFFNIFYNALIDVSSTVPIDKGIYFCGTTVNWQKISKIVGHELFSEFRQDEKLWCKKGVNVHMTQAEIRFYPTVLKNYIQEERCDLARREFALRVKIRRKNIMWKAWKDFTSVRISKRRRLEKVMFFISYHVRCTAFHILLKYSIWSISAQCVQGLVRTAIGRMELRFRFILFSSAVIIQASFRAHAQRKNLLKIVRLRMNMATKSQCVFRQLCSRRVTSKRFFTYKELDKQRTAEKKRALVEKSKAMVAIFTQRLCKRKRNQKATENRRQKELEVLRELNKLQNTYITERAIQQKELEQYYENKRIVWQRHYDEEKRYDKLKVNIERVNRKIDCLTEDDRRKNDILEMQAKIQKEIRTKVNQLEEEVVAKCQKYREFCLRCLENPTDQDEIKTGRKLKRLIRMRVQALQEDKLKLFMETPELFIIAKNEIIAEAEKEEASKQILVLNAEESKLNQQCQNILRNMNEHYERQLVADKACANEIIGKIYRMFLARKRIRHKCLEVFKKRFDERYHSYFYINLHSGKTSWEKPKFFGSGSFDIEPEDEWIILRDTHDFPYYFNPKTMRMCWEPPLGLLICQNTISYTWWKLDPVPRGRCFNFAMTQCDEDGLLYCQDCWVCKG